MAMLLGTKGEDVLAWRAGAQLLESLDRHLERKREEWSARDAEAFLGRLKGSLEEELAYEDELDRELSALEKELSGIAAPAEMVPLKKRYLELVAAHFRRRNSPLALCDACTKLHDLMLKRATELAEERMHALGQGTAPVYVLLASGDRARREQTLYGRNRYFLVHQLDSRCFYLFSRQLTLTLQEAGILSPNEVPWHGSLSEWRSFLNNGKENGPPHRQGLDPETAAPEKEQAPPLPEWRSRLEAMADLCRIAGFEPLAEQALGAAALALREQRGGDRFFRHARGVITLPLAVGRFGRWRLERGGAHHGKIDIERLGLSPLVQLVRILSLQGEVHEGGTLQRIRQLLYRGALDVDLAERLVKALQCLLQLRIGSEIENEAGVAFAAPEEFDPALDARLRGALEAVLNLQKIAYQKMVGQA